MEPHSRYNWLVSDKRCLKNCCLFSVDMDHLVRILDSKDDVLGEVYIIRNQATGMCYVGQTMTHRKNHGKYRPFGYIGRFKDHVSEALCNTKKKQCSYLNNAIRKYGEDAFIVELIARCNLDELDNLERRMISDYETLYPKGYNLTEGGKSAPPDVSHSIDNNLTTKRRSSTSKSVETKDLISRRLREHIHGNPQAIQRLSSNAKETHWNDKIARFSEVCEFVNKEDPYSHISCGKSIVRVTVKNVKTSFAGKYSTYEDLRKEAEKLMDTLLSLATRSNCREHP